MTNKIGWYDEKEREYIVSLIGDEQTPLAWSNIVANKNFGTLVTVSGASYTWFLNSSLFRLTPCVNDPLVENSGEQILITDDTTSEVWSPTPLPIRESSAYKISIGLGYTKFEHNSHQILQKVRQFVHKDKPLKIVQITLTNLGKIPRKLTVSYNCRWVLGMVLDQTKNFLWTGYTKNKNALCAHVITPDFRSKYTAFLTCEGGSNKKGLSLLPSQTVEVTFVLGVAENELLEKEILSAKKCSPDKAFDESKEFWQELTTKIQVDTPDKDLNILFNDRLIYQTLASRLWARTGLYQPSGAFGFRDQLQDCLALLWSHPEKAREQIVLAASQQLPSGEVMQWWHPPENLGSVSTSSDTPLWLVYAASQYWRVTGDNSIFDENIPYLNDPEKKNATLYQHCLLSIDRTLSLTGSHGLPLMLSGDWNDSLNNIGSNKKGESVWLSMYLTYCLNNFADICETKGEEDKAINFRQIARYQAELVEKNAWKEDKFIRAFADDGREVDFMDSIVQSWSAISGLIQTDLVKTAVNSAYVQLGDKKNGILKLLTPPVPNSSENYLGYISQYPPGTRENSGFYLHAATWLMWAFASLGEGEKVVEIMDMMNPFKKETSKYMVEPYVTASDIYSADPYIGRGGWTWYSGSAATLYFVLVEEVFGIKQRKNILTIDPCLPKSWGRVALTYHYNKEIYQIEILNPNKMNKGVKEVLCDGLLVSNGHIELSNNLSTHHVIVTMG